MGTQTGESAPGMGGWLTQMRRLPWDLFLATARAAGRATRLSQSGASAATKGVVQVTTWSKERVVCSARLLNPLRRAKRSPKTPPTHTGPRPEVAVSGTSPAVKVLPHRPCVPPPVASEGPDAISTSAAQKPDELKAKRRPPPTESPRSRVGSARREALPPEVTTAEVTAAVFAGASEKVTFRRILKELGSQDEATRVHAAAVLGTVPHELSVRALAARAARDPSARVRRECVNALTALGRSDGLPAVERALSDGNSGVRLAAVRGVYRLAGAAGAAALVRMLSDDDESVRRRAAMCIGWLGRAELADELGPLSREHGVCVRLAALAALQNLKSPAAVDDVIALLDDSEEVVRRRAFAALRTITGQQMCETFPEDEQGRQLLIARWRAWRELQRERGRPRPG